MLSFIQSVNLHPLCLRPVLQAPDLTMNHDSDTVRALEEEGESQENKQSNHQEGKHCRETWDGPVPSNRHRTTYADSGEAETDKPVYTLSGTCAGWQGRWINK